MHHDPASKQRKSWSNLTKKEFEEVYPVMEQNAKRHYNCAEILAAASEHQNAIAHLILGSEELIKTFSGLLIAKGVNLKKQSWYRKLFKYVAPWAISFLVSTNKSRKNGRH